MILGGPQAHEDRLPSLGGRTLVRAGLSPAPPGIDYGMILKTTPEFELGCAPSRRRASLPLSAVTHSLDDSARRVSLTPSITCRQSANIPPTSGAGRERVPVLS